MDGNKGIFPFDFPLAGGKGGNKGIFPFDFPLAGGKGGNKGIFPFDFPLAGGKGGNKGIFPLDFPLAGGKGGNKGGDSAYPRHPTVVVLLFITFSNFSEGIVTGYKCIPVEGIGKGSGNPGDRQGASANLSSVVADVHEADADSAYSTTVLRI